MDERCTIKLNDECLTIVVRGQEMFLRWEDMVEASFSRINAIIFEITFLRFDAECGYLEANEQMEGWDRLITELPKHLPIEFPDWQNALRNAKSGAPAATIFKRG